MNQWRTQEKFRGFKVMAGLVGGAGGGGALRTPDNFRNANKILKKVAKVQNFRVFCKRFQNHALKFRAFGRKPQSVVKIMRKVSKMLMKIQ